MVYALLVKPHIKNYKLEYGNNCCGNKNKLVERG